MSIHPIKNRKGALQPDCWLISWYPHGRKGKRERRRFYGTRIEAEEYERGVRRINRHELQQLVNPRLVELTDEWLDTYKNDHSPTTVRDVKNCLRPLMAFFGGLQIPAITPKLIEAYKSRRLETEIVPRVKNPDKLDPAREKKYIKPRTINKELSYLSSLIRWTAENGHSSPLPFQIKKFPKKMTEPPTVRIPMPEEVQAMIDVIEPEYRTIFLLYYDAGCRREEALKLRREAVRLKSRTLHVIGKGNKERIIDITTDRLHLALKEACEKTGSGYLFINPKTNKPWYSIRKAIKRAAVAAGIEERVYAHLFRHTHGTHALMAGMDLRAVQGQLGHSTSKTTEKYTHLVPELRKRQASKFNDFVISHDTPVMQDKG